LKHVGEKIHVFTEFSPVKAVILGYMGNSARIPKKDDLLEVGGYDDDPLEMGIKYPAELIK